MTNDAERDSSSSLPKSLGVVRLTIYGVGTIIGSGIYAVLAPAAGAAGTGVWLSFLFAALASAFTALSYAELASALPSAGGEHNFLRKAFPEWPIAAFLVGLFIAVHGAATLATVALTFANYLQRYLSVDAVAIAIAMIVGMTFLNVAGLKRAAWVNVSFTVTQVSCLVVLALASFASADFSPRIASILAQPIEWDGVFGATAIIFFVFTGYEHMASMSEEAKNPGKDLWRAFLFALVITTIVYVGISFAVLGLADASELATSKDPLVTAAQGRSPGLGVMISVAALLATANGVLSASLSVSRLLFGMARAGDMPQAFTRVTKTSKSPWIAAIVVTVGACAFAAIGEVKIVASLSSFGALLVFTTVNSAAIVLRRKQPELERPFRIPGRIGFVPLVPALGVLVSVLLATRYAASVYVLFAAGTALGLAAYAIVHRRKSPGDPI